MMRNRPAPTLYKSQSDLSLALSEIVTCLRENPQNIPKDAAGYYPVKYLCDLLKSRQPRLQYINRNHIVEFYFKDLVREISFQGDSLIRYDVFKPVETHEIHSNGEVLASLFAKPSDMSTALLTSIHMLRSRAPGLDVDDSGYCQVTNLLDVLIRRMPFLSYMTRNHIVELFFKDKIRNLVFNGQELIKHKTKRIVTPPDVLYFGTLKNLAKKMPSRGIRSSTKGYVKLHNEPGTAISWAQKFATQPKDKVVAVTIDAKKAHEKGCRFTSYVDGEYVVSHVDKEYIVWSDE